MQFGQSLISLGHFASEDIKDKVCVHVHWLWNGFLDLYFVHLQLSQLAAKKTDLLTVWERRKKEFEECLEYVTFLREIEHMENWIAKQEVLYMNVHIPI